jgi:5-methylcytosine-specific restriction endonuclease McrA
MKVTDEDVRRFYDSRAWKVTRTQKLILNPLCQSCAMSKTNQDMVAVQIHHMISIRTEQGWKERFNMKLLLSLCTSCHSVMEGEIREQQKVGGQ